MTHFSFATVLRNSLLAGATAIALASVAHAKDAGSPPVLPLYKTECAACHIAYPAGMLPAASWQAIMSGLTKHYGVDASLDAASTQQISAWLVANAGTGRRFSDTPTDNRISKSRWFVRQHDEVSASVFKRASVGSAANCGACHGHAADGDFNEHQVRIPK
jgi:cytochrome c